MKLKIFYLFLFLFISKNGKSQIPLSIDEQLKNWSNSILFVELLKLEYLNIYDEEHIKNNPHEKLKIEKKIILAHQLGKILNINSTSTLPMIDQLVLKNKKFVDQIKQWEQYRNLDNFLQELNDDPEWTKKTAFFLRNFTNNIPECKTDELFSNFSLMQHNLLSQNQTPNQSQIVSVLKNQSKTNIQCLLIKLQLAYIEQPHESKFDPFYLLSHLMSIDPTDSMIKVLLVSNLTQKKQYAESLREFLGLIDKNEYYRIGYDIIQRVYSTKEKGTGKVAIKGI